MLTILAKWWAKKSYIFKQEVEAATNDLHAGLSLRLVGEKRALIEQLNKDAADIEANIKAVDDKLARGYWECECGKENIVAPAVPQAEGHRISCECGKPMRLISLATMTGQEKYESDKERSEAQKIAENKRATAKAEQENAEGSEKAAKYFQGLAANNRQVADKIRSL